jgi:hypothetical protein
VSQYWGQFYGATSASPKAFNLPRKVSPEFDAHGPR